MKNSDATPQAAVVADVWPPAPETPNPLAAHDTWLTHFIRTSPSKRPLSRMLLYRELHRGAGLDLRQSIAVVNDYCNRHDVLPQKARLQQWLRAMPAFVQFGLSLLSLVHMLIFQNQLAAMHTRAAHRALLLANVHFSVAIVCLMLLTFPLVLWMAFGTDRQRRREAEEARRRIGA